MGRKSKKKGLRHLTRKSKKTKKTKKQSVLTIHDKTVRRKKKKKYSSLVPSSFESESSSSSGTNSTSSSSTSSKTGFKTSKKKKMLPNFLSSVVMPLLRKVWEVLSNQYVIIILCVTFIYVKYLSPEESFPETTFLFEKSSDVLNFQIVADRAAKLLDRKDEYPLLVAELRKVSGTCGPQKKGKNVGK